MRFPLSPADEQALVDLMTVRVMATIRLLVHLERLSYEAGLRMLKGIAT